jgi:hypothetical protein
MTKEQRESANRHIDTIAEIVQFAAQEPSNTEALTLLNEAKRLIDLVVERWPHE